MKPFTDVTHSIHAQLENDGLVAYLKYTSGSIIVYTGRTMEKQTINTIPNLLLEIMNVLAASQAQNMQQKMNWQLGAICISHAFNPSVLVYLNPVSLSTPSL